MLPEAHTKTDVRPEIIAGNTPYPLALLLHGDDVCESDGLVVGGRQPWV